MARFLWGGMHPRKRSLGCSRILPLTTRHLRPGRFSLWTEARLRAGWPAGKFMAHGFARIATDLESGLSGGSMRLKEKVALITGGTSGIGEATALLFAREGARVAITGRNKQRGAAVLARMEDTNCKAIFLQGDMSVASECERVVDETVRAFGRIDILFNNAGVFYPQTALECSEREWDEQIDVNLKGTFLMSKYALPGMIARKSG